MSKIFDKVLELILTPSVNKKVKLYKDTPSYKELERQIQQSIKSMDIIAKTLEAAVNEQEKTIKKAKGLGWDLKPWNSTDELLKQVQNRPGREEALKKLGIHY